MYESNILRARFFPTWASMLVAVSFPTIQGTNQTAMNLPCAAPGRQLKVGVLTNHDTKTYLSNDGVVTGFLSEQTSIITASAGFSVAFSALTSDQEVSDALSAAGNYDIVVGLPLHPRYYSSSFYSMQKSPPTHVVSVSTLASRSASRQPLNDPWVQWLKPFDASLWFLTFGALVVHTLCLWLLEARFAHAWFPFNARGVCQSLFCSVSILLGVSENKIRTRCGRVVMLAWSLFALILGYTYIASLANSYGQPSNSQAMDLLHHAKPTCVVSGTGILLPSSVEAAAEICLSGTAAGTYSATVGLESMLPSSGIKYCSELQVVTTALHGHPVS